MGRAVRTDCEVVLVHVLGEAGPAANAGEGARMLEGELRVAESIAPAPVRVRSLKGSVVWQLVGASDYFGLMVVGTHKTGFIPGSVFGSSALSLSATAACPVVVVPAPSIADPEDVVVGADGSVAGLAALDFTASEAAMTGQTLVIVRVSALDPRGNYDDLLLSLLCSAARAAHPDLHVRVRQIRGRRRRC